MLTDLEIVTQLVPKLNTLVNAADWFNVGDLMNSTNVTALSVTHQF